MTTVPLIFAATCDLAGKLRGKAFAAEQLPERLARGVGWTPTNALITCFDGIGEGPFGALGDLLLIPDREAEIHVDTGGELAEHLMLGDILTLEGEPWELCTRSLLKSALERLHRLAGVHLVAAFEHEFQLKSAAHSPFEGFGHQGFECHRPLCGRLLSALQGAGIEPDSIMKEYGPNQYEVVVGPARGLRAADEAVFVRSLTRSVARHLGEAATFTPIRDLSGVGNGVHIHFSFVDDNNKPVTRDENGHCQLSTISSAFAAGLLKYLHAIIALTAPSVISYQRLTPHRWSAAYNNLGFRDREAALRICPVTGRHPEAIDRQFNLEYRAADATACPHLALCAIVHAGCQGIEEQLRAPSPTEEDLSQLDTAELAARGIERLPSTLEAALDCFLSNEVASGWFPPTFAPVYAAHKAAEIARVSDMSTTAQCALYESSY